MTGKRYRISVIRRLSEKGYRKMKGEPCIGIFNEKRYRISVIRRLSEKGYRKMKGEPCIGIFNEKRYRISVIRRLSEKGYRKMKGNGTGALYRYYQRKGWIRGYRGKEVLLKKRLKTYTWIHTLEKTLRVN